MPFGELNYPYKSTWKDTSKAGDDNTGWKRGARGDTGVFDTDGRDFMRSADPKADREFYGPGAPNGFWRTSSRSRDPGTLVDDYKGSRGVDVPGNRNGPDDGVKGRSA